jgi:hypothetical protein
MKTTRVMAVLVLIVGSGLALHVAQAQERPPIFQQMFKTYGLESFGQVEKIRYTFHLELPGLNLVRSWEWEPKTDLIAYEGKDKDGAPVKVTYLRSQLSSQSDFVKNEIDPAFSNDNYVLLFLLHVSWDGSATVTAGERFRAAGSGEISLGGWLCARGHVGTLRRRRPSG